MIDINISKVCKSFGFDLVLNTIDITVQKGEKVGLIGTNGSGKSTILKIIAGQESIDSGSLSIRNNISIGYLSQIPEEKDIIVKDYINSAFKEIIELKEKLERYEDKLLTEDYKVITKYMNLQEKFISLGGYEYETKIQKILPVFNITEEILNRNFNTLSGGEKTIISLIRLLLQEPDVLLLDEPTNHLDINKMIWLEKTLKNYKGTIILVSHDRYFMDNVINKVYLLTKRGIEVYHGNYSYYIKESENRLLLELKNYKDQQKQITAMKNSIKRLKEYGRLCGPSGGEIFFRRAASIEKRLEKLEKLDKPEDKKKLNITFDTASRSGKDVLTINNLNLSYGTKEIFNNLNLSIKYQDRLCLVGDNGVGKSTLIKEILKGNNSIKLGSNIKIGYIPQEIEFEDINLSVLEEARKYFIGPEQYLRSALFKYLFAGENIHKKIKYLSGGEKVRLKIFCLIQDSYNFLILDEPTNHIDIDTREMLEESLKEFTGTILFVSHDRYFLNKVCTHIADVDFGKIKVYPGNYDFWYESSQLALKQMKDANKKKEEKIKELQEFIARFSANASKSKQATSRKKSLEKIQLDEIKPSNRRYPYIDFKPDREPGKDILTVKNLSKTVDGEKVLDNVSFTVKTDNKIAIIADNENARTTLFQILAGELEPDEGEVSFGTTITKAYFPKDNSYLFTQDLSITDWLRQYSKDPDETYVRSFLGRMLFSGDEALKNVKVLSGGEKVRCVLSKLMLSGANFLIFDEPTNHLDMESITALNEGMERFKGNMIFASHDHQLMQTVANRIIDIKKDGSVVDKECTYNEYLGLE